MAWAWSSPEIYEFTDAPGLLREKIGWLLTIERMQRAGVLSRYRRIGLIVDSDLSQHQKINEREQTLLERKLPEGITLIYASADTGRDELQNKLIASADKLADQVFQKLGNSWTLPRETYCHPAGLYKTIRFLVGRNAVSFDRI